MISAAIAGLSGHVTTIYPQDQGLSLIYGRREALKTAKGVETVLGCLPQAVVLIGAAESAETVKVLLGQEGNTLRNRMLMVDVATNTYEVLSLA
jgi:molybdopterin/thiamine biosynthesis adenylyltransferase